MDNRVSDLYNRLKEYMQELEEVVIAYSGGLESTLILKVAHDELGKEVMALIGKSEQMPERDFEDAMLTAEEIGVSPKVMRIGKINYPDYCSNPVDRCFFCTLEVYASFNSFMKKNQLLHLMDGSIHADFKKRHANEKAVEDFDVISPLRELGFTREDVIQLSKELGLSTAKNTGGISSCLSTHIENKDQNTNQILMKLDQAEKYLKGLGFSHVRVRISGDALVIEVAPEEIARFFIGSTRKEVLSEMKELGFAKVSVDMKSYKMSDAV